jgi:UrcA family protein
MIDSFTRRCIGTERTLAIGVATLLCALSAQAGTQPANSPAATRSVVVRYADLNLGAAEGARTLYARLSAAADAACGGEQYTVDLRSRLAYRACYDQALDKAVRKIDSQQLQALHAARTSSRSVG